MSQKNTEQIKPIEIKLPKGDIILDELILKYPFDLRSSYFWHLLQRRGLLHHCCCCCSCHCCCHHGGHHHSTHHAPAPAPVPAPTIQVTLSAMGYSLVVGGSIYTARVELDWNATGSGNLSVDIQVRSQLVVGTYRNWTTIYSNRPASGREAWPAAAAPGERLQFRAVATDPAGAQGISNVVLV